jgi:hypothetical protein
MTDLLRELMEVKGEDGLTHKQVIMGKLLSMAATGNLEAIKYVLDRLEGKPAQAVELSGDERRPLRIEYVVPTGNKKQV